METLCRFCNMTLKELFVDLGLSPLSNSFVHENNLHKRNNFYPLHTYVCGHCFLVQLEEFESPDEIFTDYVYFSSYSESWVQHARTYVEVIVERFGLDSNSQVLEIACNDGYLLQFMVEKQIPSIGIEPARNVAEEARKKGVTVLSEFFGSDLASSLVKKGTKADLLIGNNVLAHVPNINDFIIGMKQVLSERGVITMEFPHLLRLIEQNQFDTIYHEHFSYLSFLTVKFMIAEHGLTLFDVEELTTHGGSLRIYAKHEEDETKPITENVTRLELLEFQKGIHCIETYTTFADRVKQIKRNILQFVIDVKNQGKSIVGYGAPAKGNTLLNYCGIGKDMMDYVVDRNPAKQGLYLPGTHIPVFDIEHMYETKPDYVVIMPWNLKEEIFGQISFIRDWGGQFVVWIPEVEVFH
ncbi:class I SAM-dependent methyltransferase [Paenibacillus aceris]|nr:class I SAM-dependent methyltransferase [Paenibacillus aceris]NHW34840.1 class I SAM-dependent methyltransferase [Paenibacillus aceris]